jgi:tRNA threonylcarbamoyl adenosine modification protein (Sua5/YciO/YrdC/YwlC family)
MSQLFSIHPENPQIRLINQVVDIIQRGGVVVYPTDSGYALGCQLGEKNAVDQIRRIKKVDDKHHLTLVCRDLSELSRYAKVDNVAYRLIKSHTPGPYTFILKATSEVPRRLLHAKRKTIGLRVPDNRIAQDMLGSLNEPIMSSTLILPGEDMPMTDPYEIRDLLGNQVDAVIDGGFCGMEETTIVDFTGDAPEVVREGAGIADWQQD